MKEPFFTIIIFHDVNITHAQSRHTQQHLFTRLNLNSHKNDFALFQLFHIYYH